MSRRFTASDTRWFTNYTPTCLYENALKQSLGAKTDNEYRQVLQSRGEEILSNSFFVPKLETVKDLTALKVEAANSSSQYSAFK